MIDRPASSLKLTDLQNKLTPALFKRIPEEYLDRLLCEVTDLSLARSSVTDKDLKELMPYCKLVECDLSQCSKITDLGIEALPHTLKILSLVGIPCLSKNIFGSISKFSNLESLDLSRSSMDFNRLRKLKKLPNLKYLYL